MHPLLLVHSLAALALASSLAAVVARHARTFMVTPAATTTATAPRATPRRHGARRLSGGRSVGVRLGGGVSTASVGAEANPSAPPFAGGTAPGGTLESACGTYDCVGASGS